MVTRLLHSKLIDIYTKFPVTLVTGPRQSGKTTLIKQLDIDLPYVTLEDPDIKLFALTDPRGFLDNYPKGAIIDEAQNAPLLFSYIQGIVDDTDAKYILSGSQNFLLLDQISQSLAGRVGILKLLPFQMTEIPEYIQGKSRFDLMFSGFYPRVYNDNIPPTDFYPNYINTYIERDVRQIKNIENLSIFSNFLKLCAGRIGQPLNTASLASDAGISPNTAKSWLSLLETSYIIYMLPPHFNNFSKRIIKSPKLYFYDTGVACSLLGIESSTQLSSHYAVGNVFENFIINELIKKEYNNGRQLSFHYWQNKTKKEIDLIINKAGELYPYEIKSAATMNNSYFRNLYYWKNLSDTPYQNLNVIYGGDKSMTTSKGNYISWKDLDKVQ